MRKFFAGLAVCLFLPARLFAWNGEGHMIVAQVAYNHLDAVVKNRCDALIAVALANNSSGTSNFVTAACWADDFKTQLGTGIWHYIDQPFSLDGTPTNGVGAASFDVVRAIRLCVTTLQDTSATLTNRATCLRYLIHFVGDIQQPLHCSTAVSSTHPTGDAGGNSFTITGTWNNLHSLWDAGGGFLTDSISRPLNTSGQATLVNKVATVEAAYPFAGNPGMIPDPQTWATEGLNLAETVSYVGIVTGATPSASYLNSASNTTTQRMAVGGKRLADLLNTIFAPTPVPLAVLSLTNNNFRFAWNTTPGSAYRIQWKPDLTNSTWNDLTDVTATASQIVFTNGVTGDRRFYRAVGLP
jgi:hypothetical protein